MAELRFNDGDVCIFTNKSASGYTEHDGKDCKILSVRSESKWQEPDHPEYVIEFFDNNKYIFGARECELEYKQIVLKEEEDIPMTKGTSSGSNRVAGPTAVGFGSFTTIRSRLSNPQMASFGSFQSVGEPQKNGLNSRGDERLLVSVELGDFCELACSHCIYSDELARQELNLTTLRDMLERELKECKPVYFSFAGKEPSYYAVRSREEFTRIARFFDPKETVRIMMTNGLRIPKMMDWLPDCIDLIDISIDGDERSHDATRGPGMFKKTLENVVLAQTHFKQVGVIATATANPVAQTLEGIPRLQKIFGDMFPPEGNVGLSLSLYYDRPGNPHLLKETHLIPLLETLRDGGFPVNVLWTSNYGYLTDDVLPRVGVDFSSMQYDKFTGLPFAEVGALRFILFNLANVPMASVRVTSDGMIMEGCGYLTYGMDALKHSLGNVSRLGQIVEGLFVKGVEVASACMEKECWEHCRGGDPYTGLLEYGVRIDPYCSKLK